MRRIRLSESNDGRRIRWFTPTIGGAAMKDLFPVLPAPAAGCLPTPCARKTLRPRRYCSPLPSADTAGPSALCNTGRCVPPSKKTAAPAGKRSGKVVATRKGSCEPVNVYWSRLKRLRQCKDRQMLDEWKMRPAADMSAAPIRRGCGCGIFYECLQAIGGERLFYTRPSEIITFRHYYDNHANYKS